MPVKLLKAYLSLAAKTRYFLIEGGRGSGKSFHVAVFLLMLTYKRGHTILFTRYTMTSAIISIIKEFVEKIELYGVQQHFEVKQAEITNTITGSTIIFRGIKNSSGNQTANLKSIQGVTTWVLDEAEELTDEETFDKIDLSVRDKSTQNRVMLVMNPSSRDHWIYQRFYVNEWPDTTKIHTTYLDNIENLSESFIASAQRTKETNEARYRHIFLGEWIDLATGLLWNKQMINRLRVSEAPKLKRVIVAIDPAVTANETSDETGIVVVGVDGIGIGYVLDDLSGRYTPAQWGKIAATAAATYQADAIVGEANQGGDMVEMVIRQHTRTVRFISVRATRGKDVRAEPIYNLYEQSKVYHVGEFPLLEQQMATWNPGENVKSPDRVDALVWGLSELMLKNQGSGKYNLA